ncbi:NAAT family transporter [bacterium]|nr:NAAT family transporter [bacterium]
MSTISAAVLLFLVLDPIGNVPLFILGLKNVDPARHKRIILRESLFGLGFLLFFLFLGRYILQILHVSQSSLSITGGIILFMIAIKMIFSHSEEVLGIIMEGEPFVVPLAVPLISGPSAMATVLLLMAREPEHWYKWLTAVIIAWLATAIILQFAGQMKRCLKDRGLLAMQRLMGMILTTVSVQMFIDGIQTTFM